eukprot:g6285.t1
MGHDRSYCSPSCRRRGRSVLYANLRSMQLDGVMEARRPGSESGTSALSTAWSEPSIASGPKKDRPGGPLGWVISKVFNVISNRLPESLNTAVTTHDFEALTSPDAKGKGATRPFLGAIPAASRTPSHVDVLWFTLGRLHLQDECSDRVRALRSPFARRNLPGLVAAAIQAPGQRAPTRQ